MNHVYTDDKQYCLFFIHTKQLSLSSYMTVKKKEERVKGFFIFMTMLNNLNLTTVRKSPANEVVVGLLSFLIV